MEIDSSYYREHVAVSIAICTCMQFTLFYNVASEAVLTDF